MTRRVNIDGPERPTLGQIRALRAALDSRGYSGGTYCITPDAALWARPLEVPHGHTGGEADSQGRLHLGHWRDFLSSVPRDFSHIKTEAGRELEEGRSALGLPSQAAAARILGVGKRTYQDWLAGTAPTPKTALFLMRSLLLLKKNGITPDSLIA